MPNNFRLDEFMCPCCGGNNIQAGFVDLLERARAMAELPFKINSGWRCEARNKEIKGEEKSSHMTGWAADIACEASALRHTLIKTLIFADFNRFGIGKNFVHVDCDPAKPKNMIWVY